MSFPSSWGKLLPSARNMQCFLKQKDFLSHLETIDPLKPFTENHVEEIVLERLRNLYLIGQVTQRKKFEKKAIEINFVFRKQIRLGEEVACVQRWARSFFFNEWEYLQEYYKTKLNNKEGEFYASFTKNFSNARAERAFSIFERFSTYKDKEFAANQFTLTRYMYVMFCIENDIVEELIRNGRNQDIGELYKNSSVEYFNRVKDTILKNLEDFKKINWKDYVLFKLQRSSEITNESSKHLFHNQGLEKRLTTMLEMITDEKQVLSEDFVIQKTQFLNTVNIIPTIKISNITVKDSRNAIKPNKFKLVPKKYLNDCVSFGFNKVMLYIEKIWNLSVLEITTKVKDPVKQIESLRELAFNMSQECCADGLENLLTPIKSTLGYLPDFPTPRKMSIIITPNDLSTAKTGIDETLEDLDDICINLIASVQIPELNFDPYSYNIHNLREIVDTITFIFGAKAHEPAIKQLIFLFERLAFLYRDRILLASAQEQELVVKGLIYMVSRAWERKNFHVAWALTSVFTMQEINRLRHNFLEEDRAKIQAYDSKCDWAQNYANYRAHIRTLNSSYIPYIGILCKDFCYLLECFDIEDRNSEGTENYKLLELVGKLINLVEEFKKLQIVLKGSFPSRGINKTNIEKLIFGEIDLLQEPPKWKQISQEVWNNFTSEEKADTLSNAKKTVLLSSASKSEVKQSNQS